MELHDDTCILPKAFSEVSLLGTMCGAQWGIWVATVGPGYWARWVHIGLNQDALLMLLWTLQAQSLSVLLDP